MTATGIVVLALSLGGVACGESDSGGGLPTGSAGTSGSASGGSKGAGGIQGGFGGASSPTGASGATGAGNFVGSGAAGASSAAGFSGSAGASGAAGTSGVATCIGGATLPPVAALITDFSDAVPDPDSPGQFKFGGGSPTSMQGGTSEFADTTEMKATLAITGGALAVSASSKGSYTGVVLYMKGPACVDGSAYTGVQFDLNGSLGACNLSFGFTFADDLSPASDPQRGICVATNCYGPSVSVASTGAIKVPYSAVSGGSPDMGVDRQKLTGVQWQLQSPAAGTTCAASFTLDNVSFY